MFYPYEYCRFDDNFGYRQVVRPRQARAMIKGSPLAPNLRGVVTFTDVPGGVEAYADIMGLPAFRAAQDGMPQIGPFGFHIHNNGNCTVGNANNPFPNTGEHWNPTGQPHGNHAGDFPVLFSNHGRARMMFFTDKFKIYQIIGKSIVIHQSPDDYRTQPSGNSGKKIGCGVITVAV